MARNTRYLCTHCRSGRWTYRTYIRDPKAQGGYRPMGFVCVKCRIPFVDEAELLFPKPKSPKEPEVIILSGNRETRRYGIHTPMAGIDEEV